MGRTYSTPINLTLFGRIPSKKNSRQARFSGKKRYTVPSEAHEVWHEDQSWKLASLRPAIPVTKCEVVLTFFPPDKLIADSTNKAESVMDLLVDTGFLEDDNWFIATDIILKFGGVWRENPQVKIEIKPYENNTEA